MKRRIELDIGRRVRAARKRAGLSLDALARTSGVSKAMLSQIEQNKANPTVAVIYKVARALNLEVSDLVGQVHPRRHFNVIRATDQRYLFSSNERCTVRTLSPLWLEKDLEFYEIVLKPNGLLESEPHFRSTEEFVTVARGRIRLTSAEQSVILRKGDSAHYSADVPHSLSNLNRTPSVVYLVVKYRAE